MFFSDLHVQLLSKGILGPGEQLVSQTVTSYMPWWAFGLIQRQHLVLATDQRLILVEHRRGFFPVSQRLHDVDSLAWSNVQELKVTGLLLKKKLKIKGTGERGPVSHKFVVPNALFGLLAPMKNNMQGARAVAAVHQQRAQQGAPMLGQPPMAPALGPAPVSQGYGQPASYGQPPASYGQPASYGEPPSPYGAAPAAQAQVYGQPPMPQVNAPGYHSVPPAAPQAPTASPFDVPPRHY